MDEFSKLKLSESDVETDKEPSKSGRESSKTDRESNKTDRESNKTDRESNKTDRESSKTDRESSKTDRESNKTDRESNKTDRESSKTDRESNKTDREKNKTDRESSKTDRESSKTDKDQITEDADQKSSPDTNYSPNLQVKLPPLNIGNRNENESMDTSPLSPSSFAPLTNDRNKTSTPRIRTPLDSGHLTSEDDQSIYMAKAIDRLLVMSSSSESASELTETQKRKRKSSFKRSHRTHRYGEDEDDGIDEMIYESVRLGDIQLLKDLIKDSSKDRMHITWFGENLVMAAIRSDQVEMAEFLLGQGIDPTFTTTLIDLRKSKKSKFDCYEINCRQMAYDREHHDLVDLIDELTGEKWPFKADHPVLKNLDIIEESDRSDTKMFNGSITSDRGAMDLTLPESDESSMMKSILKPEVKPAHRLPAYAYTREHLEKQKRKRCTNVVQEKRQNPRTRKAFSADDRLADQERGEASKFRRYVSAPAKCSYFPRIRNRLVKQKCSTRGVLVTALPCLKNYIPNDEIVATPANELEVGEWRHQSRDKYAFLNTGVVTSTAVRVESVIQPLRYSVAGNAKTTTSNAPSLFSYYNKKWELRNFIETR